jgi:hypothetical protein
MSSWVGPVSRVAYNLDSWNETERDLNVEGWSVALVGDHTVDANTVVVTGPNQHQMRLLVVPPENAKWYRTDRAELGRWNAAAMS